MLDNLQKNQKDRLLEMLQEKYPGYHPLLSIAEIAHDEEADIRTRLSCHQTIVRYVESELKSVEIKAEVHEEKLVRVSLFEGEFQIIPNQNAVECNATNTPVIEHVVDALIND